MTIFRLIKKNAVFDTILLVVMLFVSFATLYPFYYCFIYSLSTPLEMAKHRAFFLPVGFTLENYRVVFRNPLIMPAFFISVARTLSGVIYTCLMTGVASYALTKRSLPGRRYISLFLMLPMYVNGGMIAHYVNTVQLGLYNNVLVYVLPAGFATYYMLIMRTFFMSLPDSLEESARLDGASEMTVFLRIIIPISMPIFATVALFAGVSQWNSWFDAMIYIIDRSKHPLQNILQDILRMRSNNAATLLKQVQNANPNQRRSPVTPESIQMATLIITTVPIVMVYPFLQRYFIKGIMIGAVKA